MKLIDDWRQAWRLWSVRVLAAASALYAFLIAFPDQALAIWQALPPELQAMIPGAPKISLVIFGAVAIARVLRQAQPPVPAAAQALPLMAAVAKVPAWRAAAAAPNARAIATIAVHCAATPEGKPFFAADIRRWHKAQGWADIGYHFVVDLDGTIEVGRAIGTAGAHVAGHNSDSVGVCYIGGVAADGRTPKDTRTPAQKAAMLELLRALKARYPRAVIQGHRDYPKVAKACPSFDARAEYRAL